MNFIKTSTLKAKFLKALCKDTGAEHSSQSTKSCGNVLSRTFELRQEILIFLQEEHKEAESFGDADF